MKGNEENMFIVIDGPDGSGKTTLAKKLFEKLNETGKAFYTYEPTNESDYGIDIHDMLKLGDIKDVYDFSDLFVKDRKYHIDNVIKPHLEKGDIVICDRYKYSALAYQQLQGVNPEYLIDKNKDFIVPDVVFILNLKTPEILLNRIRQRKNDMEIFEKKDFLEKVIEIYNRLPEYFPNENFVYLNACLSLNENVKTIIDTLTKNFFNLI